MGTPNLPVKVSEPNGERGTLFVAVRGQGAFQVSCSFLILLYLYIKNEKRRKKKK